MPSAQVEFHVDHVVQAGPLDFERELLEFGGVLRKISRMLA